jgi:glycosyltransferase involved in cell wall biosynthesis
MVSSQTLVSVVVPAFNAEKTLHRTLMSVLAQSYSNMEIIVVDDGSTDGTAAILSRFASLEPRIRVVRQGNEGVAAARNRGINLAAGDYIAPLDADDIWHPTKIEKQVNMIEKNPKVGLVYSWYHVIDIADRVIETSPPTLARGDCLTWLIVENFIGNSSSPLIRRALFLQIGGYDTSLRIAGAQGAEDYLMQFNIAELAQFEVVPEYLVGYRRLPCAMSSNFLTMLRSYCLVLERVKRRFPFIPSKLFRWAEAEASAYYSMLHIRSNPGEAAALFIKIALKDPVVAWHMILKPVYRRTFRRSFRHFLSNARCGQNKQPSDYSASGAFLGRDFLEVNPSAMPASQPPAWKCARIQFARAYEIPSRSSDGIPATHRQSRGMRRR